MDSAEAYGQVVVVTTFGQSAAKPTEELYFVAEASPEKAAEIVRLGTKALSHQIVEARWPVRQTLLDSLGLKPGQFKSFWR